MIPHVEQCCVKHFATHIIKVDVNALREASAYKVRNKQVKSKKAYKKKSVRFMRVYFLIATEIHKKVAI